MAIDPVCGMTVDPGATAHRLERGAETFFFCGRGCLERFRQESEGPTTTPAQWTCPMHPEIVRDAPGPCPICGMALEPRLLSVAEEPSAELRDMTRRLRVGAAFTAPLLLLALTEMWPGNPLPEPLTPRAATLLQMLLATPVVLWGGAPFFARGWASVLSGR